MTFKELELALKWVGNCGFKVKAGLPLGKYGKSNLAESDKYQITLQGHGQNVRFSDFSHFEAWFDRMLEKVE